MIQGSAILLRAAFMPFGLMRVIPMMEGAIAGEGVARTMGAKAAGGGLIAGSALQLAGKASAKPDAAGGQQSAGGGPSSGSDDTSAPTNGGGDRGGGDGGGGSTPTAKPASPTGGGTSSSWIPSTRRGILTHRNDDCIKRFEQSDRVSKPGLFGTLIGPAVATVERPDSWTNRGRRRRLIPIIALLVALPAIIVVVIVVGVVAVLIAVGTNPLLSTDRSTRTFGVLIRVAWMTIAVAGLAALLIDIRQLA